MINKNDHNNIMKHFLIYLNELMILNYTTFII